MITDRPFNIESVKVERVKERPAELLGPLEVCVGRVDDLSERVPALVEHQPLVVEPAAIGVAFSMRPGEATLQIAIAPVHEGLRIGESRRVFDRETDLRIDRPVRAPARAAMAYARGKAYRNDQFSGDLASIDPLTFVAGLGYDDPAGRFGGQLTLTHHSQKELGAVRAVCTATCYRPDPALILDLTARVRVTNAITVRGGVFNLLDKKYVTWADVRGLADTSATRDAFTRPGRNASASLSFRF